MLKPTVSILCQNTHQSKFLKQLGNQFKLFFPDTIEALKNSLENNEIACVIANPTQNGSCQLWQFREISEKFGQVPLIITCDCGDFEFIKTCSDTFADECIDFNEIGRIADRIQSVMDRYDFQKMILLSEQTTKLPPRVRKALKLISLGFTKIKFAEEVSRQLDISVITLRKEFKEYCGVPFTQYLIQTKLRYATYLAQNKGLTGKNIAGRCGFNDEHEFYRCFKNKMGMPFAEYRTNYTLQDFTQFYRTPK